MENELRMLMRGELKLKSQKKKIKKKKEQTKKPLRVFLCCLKWENDTFLLNSKGSFKI